MSFHQKSVFVINMAATHETVKSWVNQENKSDLKSDQKFSQPFNLEKFCNSNPKETKYFFKNWLVEMLLHFGMAIFGSTAREMVKSYRKNSQLNYYENHDIDAFGLNTEGESSSVKNELLKLSKCKRWNKFVETLNYFNFSIEQVITYNQQRFLLEYPVCTYEVSCTFLDDVIRIQLIDDDLTVVKHSSLDSDVNSFAITELKNSDVKFIYLGNNKGKDKALENLDNNQFEFMLHDYNTELDREYMGRLSKRILHFYKGVLRSDRFCKLLDAGYTTKALTSPVHGTFKDNQYCFLCGKGNKCGVTEHVWTCFSCHTPMHHECFLRTMRDSFFYMHLKENRKGLEKIVECPKCKTSPL